MFSNIASKIQQIKYKKYKHIIKIRKKKLVAIIMHIKPLNAKLNPICHLLVLLEAHHILHISKVRVNLLDFWKFFNRYL